MLKDKIYKVILELKAVKEQLAQYDNKPAVFYQYAPNQNDSGWNDSTMIFPYIVYSINSNLYRKKTDVLKIGIFCSKENNLSEKIALEIRKGISKLFLTAETNIYCMNYMHSQSFAQSDTQAAQITGVTLFFDIIAIPKQEENGCCPLWALNQFVKKYLQNSIVIGLDHLQEAFQPTDEKPVVYISQKKEKNMYTTYAMAWQQIELEIHIFTHTAKHALYQIQNLFSYLSIEQEAIMENGSPVLFMKISQNSRADPLFKSQITVKAQYGLLREQKEEPKLNNVFTELEV